MVRCFGRLIRVNFAGLLGVLGGVICSAAEGASVSGKQLEFFEKKVRPVLVSHCYECHGPKKQKSKLRVDSLGGLLKGGERGPAIKRGNGKESLLILAINHGEKLQMPEKKKLPAGVIADLTKWVQMGAPWPNSGEAGGPAVRKETEKEFTEAERNFWAFRPMVRPRLPQVKRQGWAQSPIDYFVLAGLERKGFKPAPRAGKRTLIRRATLDLIGLPPTPKEVAAFLADQSPDAFAKVVNRLLASPRYGERWGRHWLDVARYADSNGLDENLAYANAYHYRDYVIRSFNADKPYNRFVQEQLAGDLLPAEKGESTQARLDRLIATAFLSLGPKMLAEDDPRKMEMDIVDEQVDTVSRTFMGMTMGCVRCHDHKFDPLRMSDYYGLAGIFKSTKTMENFKVVAVWHEHELQTDVVKKAREAHDQKVEAIAGRLKQIREKAKRGFLDRERRKAGDYFEAAVRTISLSGKGIVAPRGLSYLPQGAWVTEAEKFARGNVLRDMGNYGKGIGIIGDHAKQKHFVEYEFKAEKAGRYEIRLRYAAKDARPVRLLINGKLVKENAMGKVTGGWHPQHQQWISEGVYEFTAGVNVVRLEDGKSKLFSHLDMVMVIPDSSVGRQLNGEVFQQWVAYLKKARKDKDALWGGLFTNLKGGGDLESVIAEYRKRLSDRELGEYRAVLLASGGPFRLPSKSQRFFLESERKTIHALEGQRKALGKSRPVFPKTMGVREGKVGNLRIHYRGNYLTLGYETPRGFPKIMGGAKADRVDAKASGRLALARWLTDGKHPLTARVMANRIWRWHFGEGIVRSPDNFGRLGDRPDHPELLDWLALELVKGKWSIKSLHRTIMQSATYQMSSAYQSVAAEVDPENRSLWRFSRRRMEAEVVRDSILFLGGVLDTTMYGQLLGDKNRAYVTGTASRVNLYQNNRRSVYQPILRSAVYPTLMALDFPDPSTPNGDRATTTVAPQALLMINSELVAAQSKNLAKRILEVKGDEVRRLKGLYEWIYSRPPRVREVKAGLAFLKRMEAAYAGAGEREPGLRAWQSLCRVMLASNEFVYIN